VELLLNLAWLCLGIGARLWWRMVGQSRFQACGSGRAALVLSVVWLFWSVVLVTRLVAAM